MSSDPQEGGGATGDVETGGAVNIRPDFKDQVRAVDYQSESSPRRHNPKPAASETEPQDEAMEGTVVPLVTAAAVSADTTTTDRIGGDHDCKDGEEKKNCRFRLGCNWEYEVERFKFYWALSVLAAVVFTATIILGSLCGTGHCTSPIAPACVRTIGPLTSTVTGGELAFQFADLPDATGDVTVRISYRGDFGRSGEFATILGEGGAEIGITSGGAEIGITSGGSCGTTPQEEDFVVAQDTFNWWNEDLKVDLNVDLSDGTGDDGVDAICDNIINGTKTAAEVSLTLLYDAPGGCP